MQPTLSVILPGGLQDEGVLQRRAEFKAVTGWIEQVIYSSRQQLGNLPLRVTEILSTALQSIGDKAADMARVSALCVADRQYLMLCLARLIAGDQYWLHGKCGRCGEPFDINIKQSGLPVQEATAGFPHVTLAIHAHSITLRSPTGADQQAIRELDNHAALSGLLRACIVALVPDDITQDEFIGALDEAELATIDDALDRISPSIGTVIKTACPECRAEQTLALDPYHIVKHELTGLYQEVHKIACHYHWSEKEILTLPRHRRQLYLRLIDSSQGLHG